MFKGFATRLSDSYPVRYIRSRQRRYAGSSDKLPTSLFSDDSGHGGQNLPAVPKGTLSGIRSFIRNSGRTKPVPATEPLGSFTELKTIEEDLDYHARLKKELREEVRGPLSAEERIGRAV